MDLGILPGISAELSTDSNYAYIICLILCLILDKYNINYSMTIAQLYIHLYIILFYYFLIKKLQN